MKDLLSQKIQRAINKADCSGKIPLGGWVSDMCANVIKHSLDNEATDSESDEETSPIPPASHLSRCGLSGNHPTNLSHSAAAQTTPSDQPGLPAGWGATDPNRAESDDVKQMCPLCLYSLPILSILGLQHQYISLHQ